MHRQDRKSFESAEGEKRAEGPWSTIPAGVFLLLLAWYLHHRLSALEITGGTISVNLGIALLYKGLGKWGVVMTSAIPGVVMLIAGIRNLLRWQDVDVREAEISGTQAARIERGVSLVASLVRPLPLVLTWLLLARSAQAMLRFSELLPLSFSDTTRWLYAAWTLAPFSLPAIYSLVFRNNFVRSVGFLLVTGAMLFMSTVMFESSRPGLGRFDSTISLLVVPVAQWVWTAALIHLVRRNDI